MLPPKTSSKKTLPEAIARIQAEHPAATVELWAEDEHRIGLKPIVRRVWCKKRCRPLVTVQHRYTWTYLYGFVRPDSGETFWLLAPTVSTAAWNVVLAEFATALGAGPCKQVIVVLDGAGWHTSKKVELPEGLHLVFLPSHSPELQPAERLWSLTDEALVNQHFSDIQALEEAQAQRCQRLAELPDVVRAHTSFHWWPHVYSTSD
jgi:hypothetical protein